MPNKKLHVNLRTIVFITTIIHVYEISILTLAFDPGALQIPYIAFIKQVLVFFEVICVFMVLVNDFTHGYLMFLLLIGCVTLMITLSDSSKGLMV
ncbi:membrane hypothetical protein [Aeromonas veronii]|uniref:Uncharacterized protein n=1 Tax=Aeromonas veronii TaxID=654 RepID=A0A653L0F1_AERVE|nr:membrane hypothetical protein [Aeromonas veronii]